MKTINKIGMALFIVVIVAVGFFIAYLEMFRGGSEDLITWSGTFATMAILITAMIMWNK